MAELNVLNNFTIVDDDTLIINHDEQTIIEKIKKDKNVFINLPNNKKTENLCIQLMYIDATLIEYIPNKTPKIIIAALKNKPKTLQYLTIDEQLPNYCEIVVNNDGMNLEYIKDQTDKAYICLLATDKNPEALQFVQHQTYDICMQAILKNPETIKYVKIKDELLYYEAVKLDGNTIKYVPIKYQTEKICELALSYNGLNLEYIENQTPKLCQIALNNTIESCKFIKSYLQIIYNNNDLEVKYKDNIKVMIHDYNNNKTYYKNYDKTLLSIIFNYVENELGERGLNNTKKIFANNKSDPEKIRLDNSFTEGLFIMQVETNKYNIYEKKIQVNKVLGYIMDSTNIIPSIQLIRTYGLMEYLTD
ncbi:hypothetical protein Hokovirus_3_140 [Hokovirus HKV1]|uniref:DUF4116 domain-containing protein n=1 Tax=Hokovirus HKV1 TaxID=1977638 RepID=A0A1V0SGM2_9VIRU|nr:hypothetical protein Hokovirus_3_140 [Hokovirus HKV1]